MTLGVLLGIAVLDWMARNAPPSPVRNAIVLGNSVGFASIAVLDVWSTFGAGRPMTKLFVLVHVFFAVAFIWAGRTWWWRAPDRTEEGLWAGSRRGRAGVGPTNPRTRRRELVQRNRTMNGKEVARIPS